MKRTSRRNSIIPFVLTVSTCVSAQLPSMRHWQRLSDPTLHDVRIHWDLPPSEYGPEPYYGLNGRVTIDDVRRDLDTMKSLGFRAVTVQYGHGMAAGYLSPEYFAFFKLFVQEAKRRDMRVWIVDDAGYPSGFAGGMFTTAHPELRMQALTITQQKSVAAGEVFDIESPTDTVAVTAMNVAAGRSVQLRAENSRISWRAPSDGWTVFMIGHVFRTSPTRSDTNPNGTKDTSQSLEDYLDPAATAQFLSFTHDQYKKAVGVEFGHTILGFRGDEPDYSIAGLPWTPKFFSVFEQKKGYDIRPFLASFLQPKAVALTAEQIRAKADYYDVFADMFRDGFFKPQGEWCAANGLEYQVHLNHEEMQLDLTRSEGDFFRDMRYVQVPGIDTIWHQIWTDTISDFPRLASSAAHVYGHPRSFTESFAAYRPAPDITMARYILNEQFVRGINLVETMYYPATTDGRGGPSPLMRDRGFPALMKYVSRLSFLMSQGHPSAGVALLLPASSLWMGDRQTDDTFVAAERLLSEHQIDFDVVDEDAIGQEMRLEAGTFVSGSGNRYRTVIVPSASILSSPDFDRLRAFSQLGGKVVFLTQLPERVGGRTFEDAKTASATDFSWATFVPGVLPRVPTPPAQPPATAPEAMVVDPQLWHALALQLPPSFAELQQYSADIRIAHRELRDASVVLVFNESGRIQKNQLLVSRAQVKAVELWDPATGKMAPAKFHRIRGKAILDLDQVPAYETKVFVIR